MTTNSPLSWISNLPEVGSAIRYRANIAAQIALRISDLQRQIADAQRDLDNEIRDTEREVARLWTADEIAAARRAGGSAP